MLNIKPSNKDENSSKIQKPIYKVLIIDDEESIHDITKIVLSSMTFKKFEIELLHANSAKDAQKVLLENSDIALALIDVVMETPTAGLDLVNIIRNEHKNDFIRLVIRTGQADVIPKMEVIEEYDINDFKEKTELTVDKLYSTIRNSVTQYIQLQNLNKKYEDSYYQMTHNQLTKLPNRIQLNTDCEKKKNQTLILIDIVGFSLINDSNGFEVGDVVLKELGAFLQSMYSSKYCVYHLDRDIFALVTKDEDFAHLTDEIIKIKDDISNLHIVTNNFNKTIDTTIGVAYQDGENLIRKAELALQEARDKGKNQIQFYSDDLKIIQRIQNTNLWSGRIKDAISQGKLLAYYQPIIDIKSQKLVKYEALVRLDFDGTIYSPEHFLGAALYSGQLYDIFKVMFTKSCQKAEETSQMFSVNVSDTDILQNNFLSFVRETLNKHPLSAQKISLEILEYKSITPEIKDIICDIHKLGVKILIDDFGIQCSNFAQLEGLPIEILKIDGSFIKDITTNENSQIIVQTILLYAKAKKIKLLAEFVCNKDIYEYILPLGIDYIQGYYISEPLKDIE
ncbi:EAL domain-containing protein [Sulfurimonas sp. SAG-AH-194-L11]|nr:GGDEF and EAL domain-containing protein [Sulfurimonas sp. SAG-AH-194-L11]MDF1876421.1 EAL domain-containing protein [Sulfurimonas sp. SAG-AH-194-L11]